MKDTIIGINCTLQPDGSYTFEGNAAVVTRGVPVAAVTEERVSHTRYDGRFRASLAYLLERTGVTRESIEAVAVCGFAQPTDEEPATRTAIARVVMDALGAELPICFIPSHHEAHALCAASQSGFDDALVAVIDGDGSILGPRRAESIWQNQMERTTFYRLRDGGLSLIGRDHDGAAEVGYGKAYSRVTRYLGFQSYQHAGKTMGLAPFGDPGCYGELRLFEPEGPLRFRTSMRNSADGQAELRRWFEERGAALPPGRAARDPVRRSDMHVARWIQEELESAATRQILAYAQREGVEHVCGAGGVFLNSVMNRRLDELLGPGRLFVPASPADAGLALGAAAWYLWKRDGRVPSFPANPYLGGSYSDAEMELAIERHGREFSARRCDDVARVAAQALARSEVIGWFQGASEFGPRALGNRSILADPRGLWTKDILNHDIKGREWFRPYAPAVLLEHASRYYGTIGPVPFMMSIAPALAPARRDAPSCVHVDETARLQTVDAASNPLFARLISEYSQLTGIPIVLNTSFNLGGMAIVERPEDAIACFKLSAGIAHLFLGPYQLSRTVQKLT